MRALPVTFTRSVLDTSTYRFPGLAQISFVRAFYFLKIIPKKGPFVSSEPLGIESSCVRDGRVLPRVQWRSGHGNRRLWFSEGYKYHRICPVSIRATAILAHENRPVSKPSVDTSDTGVGPSVPEPDTDDQQREQSTADASPQSPETNYEEEKVGEREKLRRQRIGLANKGKVPWNKGRQHSPETIERIRQRTYQAMHSPKVKAKLKLNPRHPQSDATRVKIRDKLREQWELKRKIRGYQDACLKEWKEYVAEAARLGGPGEEEYEWNSYSILKRRLRDQERFAKKSAAKGPKRRSARSDEHRQKISAAIRAKWEDPDYQQKVRDGMMKTGRAPIQRRKNSPTRRTGVFEKKTSSENAIDQSFIDAVMSEEKPSRMSRSEVQELAEQETHSPPVPKVKPSVKPIRKVNLLQRVTQKSEREKVVEAAKPVEPTSNVEDPTPFNSSAFMDEKIHEKLEKLKLLQANRAIMEQRRKESAYHARLLMAEAEKAARALEAAATKDEFAMASLSETRRLMAEAARLIQSAESGHSRLTSSNQSS